MLNGRKHMNKRKANLSVKEILITGYGHYPRKEEKRLFEGILLGMIVEPIVLDDVDHFPLASKELRSIKNGLICTVAVICRAAADLGADDEKCYALSDYYINEIENVENAFNYASILNGIFTHYTELVSQAQLKTYTLPIRRAIIFIRQHIYEKCSLKDIADALNLNPVYLSSKFRNETGYTVTDYILNEKINEAKSLLESSDYAISEISDMLGFSGMSYFAKIFKKICGCTPTEYKNK
jgi:AraC-like DNA-binding protein